VGPGNKHWPPSLVAVRCRGAYPPSNPFGHLARFSPTRIACSSSDRPGVGTDVRRVGLRAGSDADRGVGGARESPQEVWSRGGRRTIARAGGSRLFAQAESSGEDSCRATAGGTIRRGGASRHRFRRRPFPQSASPGYAGRDPRREPSARSQSGLDRLGPSTSRTRMGSRAHLRASFSARTLSGPHCEGDLEDDRFRAAMEPERASER